MCPRKKATARSKEKESQGKTSLERIIHSTSSGLASYSEEAREYLVSLAKDGTLEEHQTKGNITKLSDELLRKLRGSNDAN